MILNLTDIKNDDRQTNSHAPFACDAQIQLHFEVTSDARSAETIENRKTKDTL